MDYYYYYYIIIIVFDGVFFWNEYSNIRSEKPTSIRCCFFRASPNGNQTLKHLRFIVQCGLYMYTSFNLAAAAYTPVRLIVRKIR